jgi:hypothetical protein
MYLRSGIGRKGHRFHQPAGRKRFHCRIAVPHNEGRAARAAAVRIIETETESSADGLRMAGAP